MEWWKELGDVVSRHCRDGETFLFLHRQQRAYGQRHFQLCRRRGVLSCFSGAHGDGSPGYFKRRRRHLAGPYGEMASAGSRGSRLR